MKRKQLSTTLDTILRQRQNRAWVVLLISSAFVFGVISLSIGLRQSVWFDEAYSISLARQSVAGLLHLTSLDTHPPLYYLLLKGWAGLFDFSAASLRSLSVVFAMGAVVVAGLIAARLFGRRTATLILPYIVLSPLLLRYGFEIRMYSLAAFVGLGATYLLILASSARTPRSKTWLWIGYAVLVAVGTYSLYYLVLLWLAHLAWLLTRSLRAKRSIFREPWVKAYGLAILLFVPYLPSFWSQIHSGAAAAISQPLTFENIGGIVSFAFLYHPLWQLSPAASLLLVVLTGLLIYTALKALRVSTSSERSGLRLLLALLLVPVSILALVGLFVPAYTERYISHVIVYGYLFVGATAVIALRGRSLKSALIYVGMVLALMFGVLTLATVGNYNFQRLQKPTVDLAAASLMPCDPSRPIVASDPYTYIELSYYLHGCNMYFFSPYASLSGGYAPVSGSQWQLKTAAAVSELGSPVVVYYDGALAPELSLYVSTLHSPSSYGALRIARPN